MPYISILQSLKNTVAKLNKSIFIEFRLIFFTILSNMSENVFVSTAFKWHLDLLYSCQIYHGILSCDKQFVIIDYILRWKINKVITMVCCSSRRATWLFEIFTIWYLSTTVWKMTIKTIIASIQLNEFSYGLIHNGMKWNILVGRYQKLQQLECLISYVS